MDFLINGINQKDTYISLSKRKQDTYILGGYPIFCIQLGLAND